MPSPGHLELDGKRRPSTDADRQDRKIDPIAKTRRLEIPALALDDYEIVPIGTQGLVAAALAVKPRQERILKVLIRPSRMHHPLGIAMPGRNPDLQDDGRHGISLASYALVFMFVQESA